MLSNSFQSMMGRDLWLRFMNPEFSKANILLRTHLSSSSECLDLERLVKAWAAENLPRDIQVELTGFSLVMAHSAHLITRGQIESLSIALAVVFLIMFGLFLSIKVGGIAMLPNFFPIIICFGMLGWLDMELSMATSLIAGIAIGLAVDDTIHYLFRYNREFKKDLDKEKALRRTLDHVGRPVIFTSLTISLGFAVLLFSNFQPTSAFGLMMIVTILSALVGDLFILPAAMQHVELVTLWDLLRLKLGRDPQEGIPLFTGLSRSQVHYVIMAGALRKLEAGQYLFRKGAASDSMYALISGKMEVLDDPEASGDGPELGQNRLIARVNTGDVVGEMGLVRSCQRTASVRASTPVELLEVNRSMIKRLTWLYPPTAQRFFFNLMSILCDRLEKTTEALTREAVVDVATGLMYRRPFIAELEKELKRAERYGAPLCLAMLDIDRFTTLNDDVGFEKAEALLADIGRSLKYHLRTGDLVCLWSGHRFAALLTNTPSDQARLACRRLSEIISSHGFRNNSKDISITASIGLASYDPGERASMVDLVSAASKALEDALEIGGAGLVERRLLKLH